MNTLQSSIITYLTSCLRYNCDISLIGINYLIVVLFPFHFICVSRFPIHNCYDYTTVYWSDVCTFQKCSRDTVRAWSTAEQCGRQQPLTAVTKWQVRLDHFSMDP